MAAFGFLCFAVRCSKSSSNVVFRLSSTIPQLQQNRYVKIETSFPPAPKRPVVPYFQFVKDRLPLVSKQQIGTKQTELVKIIAEEWNKLNPESKKKYTDSYTKAVEKYKIEESKWKNSLTKAQLTEIENIKRADKESKLKRRERRQKRAIQLELKKLGKPKRPHNSFNLLLMKQYKTEKSSLKPQSSVMNSPFFSWLMKSDSVDSKRLVNFKEAAIKAAEKWRQMTDEEKKPYVEEANKAMEKYKQDLQKWKTQMQLEGHDISTKLPTKKTPTKKKRVLASRIKKVSAKAKSASAVKTTTQHKKQSHDKEDVKAKTKKPV